MRALAIAIVVLSLGGVSAAQPAPPAVTLSVGIKTVTLRWRAVTGAAAYRVYDAPDLGSPFAQVGGDIPQRSPGAAMTFNLLISVPRLRWEEVLFHVDACDATGACSSSTDVSPAGQCLSAIGYFKASNAAAGDQLGGSVAISADGTTLAVGAFNQGGGQGAVYVFTRAGASWSEQALLKAPTPVAGGTFGYALSISDDGSTLAVGAFGEAFQRGSAYVFTRTGTTWSSAVQLAASNAQANDTFGAAVALSGDGNTLAIGAPGEDSNATGVGGNQLDNSAPASGAVYVFARSGTPVGAHLKPGKSGPGSGSACGLDATA